MKTSLLQKNKHLLILAIILIFAASLRMFRILNYQQPVFADEAIYVRWAQVMRSVPELRFLPLTDGKQPLFMWSVIPFFKLFTDPLIAGRMISVVTGLTSLVGIYYLSYSLFASKKAALVASILYAVSPFAVFFDSVALVDSMLSMFGIWVLLFSLLTVKFHRSDYAMLTGFALGGAFLTKSPAIYFALLIPSTWFFAKWQKGLKNKVLGLMKLVFLFLPTYIIAFGMYNILRLGPNFYMLSSRSKDYLFPLSHVIENPFDPLIPFLDRTLEWLWIWGPALLVPLAVFSLITYFKKFPKQIFVIMLWLFVPLIISAEYVKVFTARYVFYIFPPLVVLASLVFEKKLNKILSVLLVMFIGHSLYINFLLSTDIEKAPFPRSERMGYLEEWTAGYGIREVFQYIENNYINNPQKKIVVGTEGYFGTLPDGLQIYLNKYPEITVIGVGLGLTEVPQSLKESKEAGNKTYLVINNSRLNLKKSPEETGLKLIHEYPKALRGPGSHEFHNLGPQEKLFFFEVI